MTVEIKDGDILGYISIGELSNKTGVAKGTIRQLVHRGHLQALEIGHGTTKFLYFPKDTAIPVRPIGRPRKEE